MSKKFVPLRNYIFDRLYHPTQGYFCKSNFQVGELSSPINFKNLIGYDDYQKELVQKYPPNAWLTPCEIFKPYYGMTIAKYIKAAHEIYGKSSEQKQKIRIVEAGAGTGSAAESILYYFSNYHRELLPNIEYTIVEISPSLCKRIQQKLTQSNPQLMKSKQIKIVNQDISDYRQEGLCFGLFFEVLDNLPHDKILWNEDLNRYDKFVTVDIDSNQEATEHIEKDSIIKECLDIYNKSDKEIQKPLSVLDKAAEYFVNKMNRKIQPKSKDLFLPTYLLRMMKRLKKNVPGIHLVMSDFDKLVTSVPGINAPIVSTKGFKSDEKQDYNTYLVERGSSDIFFPVNFNLLAKIHEQVLGRQAKIVKSYEFIEEFSERSWTLTKSEFNPIKQDFGNTSFLVTDLKLQ